MTSMSFVGSVKLRISTKYQNRWISILYINIQQILLNWMYPERQIQFLFCTFIYYPLFKNKFFLNFTEWICEFHCFAMQVYNLLFYWLSPAWCFSDAELMQYLKPVGFGPSSKTWPRCEPHLLQLTSTRFIKKLLSTSSLIFSFFSGA